MFARVSSCVVETVRGEGSTGPHGVPGHQLHAVRVHAAAHVHRAAAGALQSGVVVVVVGVVGAGGGRQPFCLQNLRPPYWHARAQAPWF